MTRMVRGTDYSVKVATLVGSPGSARARALRARVRGCTPRGLIHPGSAARSGVRQREGVTHFTLMPSRDLLAAEAEALEHDQTCD